LHGEDEDLDGCSINSKVTEVEAIQRQIKVLSIGEDLGAFRHSTEHYPASPPKIKVGLAVQHSQWHTLPRRFHNHTPNPAHGLNTAIFCRPRGDKD